MVKKISKKLAKRKSKKKVVNKSFEKEKFSLKNMYEDSWNYIKSSKNFIWLSVGIFLFFVLIGFLIPAPDFLVQKISEFIQELLIKTENLSSFGMIKFIFLNNIQSSFFGILFGIFLGIFPIFASIMNGYLLGFVASVVTQSEGFFSLWRLLPHGIFELPAIFISFGLGIRLGISLFDKKKYGKLKYNFISCLKVFLLFILPLLIVAAIIEGLLISLNV